MKNGASTPTSRGQISQDLIERQGTPSHQVSRNLTPTTGQMGTVGVVLYGDCHTGGKKKRFKKNSTKTRTKVYAIVNI